MDTLRKSKKWKASKSSGTEYCPGFVDTHGQWNNGFYCPKWGSPDIQYCCGPEDHKYCCPKEETQEKLHASQTQQISLLIGLAIGSFVLLMATLILSCFFCRCCWAYKRRKRLQGSPSLPAYPGLPRDITEVGMNYAVCPHGTVYPEFMMPAPQYPTDAPPPYPGEETALPLEEKQQLPPPDVDRGEQLGEETCLSEMPNHHRNSDSQRTVVHAESDRMLTNECTDLRSDQNASQPNVAMETTRLQCAVIPNDHQVQGCHNDEPVHPISQSLPTAMPSTSRSTRYQIPKFKSSHSHHKGKRHGGYDARSISSTDSDSYTG